MSSKSLKHLSINDCYFGYKGSHTLICTPNLVSLRLDGHFASVPVLGSMPSLKEAFARDHIWDCGSEDCFSCNGFIPDESDYKNKCFLLQGLSEAENLTLMCDYNGVRFCKFCPLTPLLHCSIIIISCFVRLLFFRLLCCPIIIFFPFLCCLISLTDCISAVVFISSFRYS